MNATRLHPGSTINTILRISRLCEFSVGEGETEDSSMHWYSTMVKSSGRVQW